MRDEVTLEEFIATVHRALAARPHSARDAPLTLRQIPEHPDDAPKRDPKQLEVELAYALGRDYWGRGYATEAGRAVLDYAFRAL